MQPALDVLLNAPDVSEVAANFVPDDLQSTKI